MEKASSLIETVETVDQVTGGNISEGATSQDVARDISPSAETGGALASGVTEARGETGAAHPRSGRGIESGVFPGLSSPVSSERLVESLQSALSAASRSEAGLGSLHRSVRDASRALTASRHAQEALTEELRVMYRGLNEVMSEKAAVERYAALLTQERDAALDAAEDARREAKREREFLLREQDRFIQLLLEEHEAEVQQLRRGLAFQAPANQSSPSVDEEPPPETVPGVAPPAPFLPLQAVGERPSVPPSRDASSEDDEKTLRVGGAALARLALASSGAEGTLVSGTGIRRAVIDTPPETAKPEDEHKSDERAPTYPPAPTVLDLDSLAAEVDGNSERPPPIRRIGLAESPRLQLKPSRVPSQAFDTLVSHTGEVDPSRKR